MRRSKLELYEDIICAIAKRGLTIDSLAFECNTSCMLVKERLEFLANHNIVSIEISRDNRAYYLLTSRGVAISKTVAVTKRLRKLQRSPQASAQALETIAAILEENEEGPQRDL